MIPSVIDCCFAATTSENIIKGSYQVLSDRPFDGPWKKYDHDAGGGIVQFSKRSDSYVFVTCCGRRNGNKCCKRNMMIKLVVRSFSASTCLY